MLVKRTTSDVLPVPDSVEFWLIPDGIFLGIKRSCFAGVCFERLESCD